MPRPSNFNLSGEYLYHTGYFKGYDHIKDFETYYQNAQQGMDNKEEDHEEQRINDFKSFINDLVSKTVEFNNDALDKDGEKDFIGLVTRMQKEVQSPLKTLLRTMLLDTYATMAGDLDSVNTDNKKNLDQVIAMTELYDAILNEQDKREIQDAFRDGKAGKFLTNVDQDMSGSFSKTLSALYSKYREPNQTPEEKKKWNMLCNSYAVRPYINVISAKVKQAEKQERTKALKAEAEALNQNPKEFVSLSPAERNVIRQAAMAPRSPEEKQLEEKKKEIAALDKEITALDKELMNTSKRAVSVHKMFVDTPAKLARAAADFQLTTKDSVQFRQMYGALTKLGNTDGFRQMDQLLAEGNGKELIDNLNLAIQNTQNYITHANQKTFLQKGLLGSKRLTAAKNTLEELTGLSRMIQEETRTLQDRQNKKEKLDELKGKLKDTQKELEDTQKELQKLKPKSMSVAETAVKMDRGRKISVAELDSKINGKKAVVSEKKDASSWVVVDHENEKQAGRGMGK